MKKVFFLLICLFLYLSPYTTLAFDTYVIHPALARAVAAYYNQQSPSPLSTQEIEWLTQGALEEDEPIIRAFNHFYNPVTKEGLSVAGVSLGLPSPIWAHARIRQRLHPGGDCTWQAARDAYMNQDRARGFRCLGHILHLLEDAGVPAHTRNDQHATGDLFEEWAKYHNPPVSDEPAVIRPQCTTDQACIIELATWINKNFVSEDTLTADSLPLPFSEARVAGGYLMYEGHKIAAYNPNRHSFVLTQEIQAEYWRLISPVILEYGRQLLTIFFQETGRETVSTPTQEPSPAPLPITVSTTMPILSTVVPVPNVERPSSSPPIPKGIDNTNPLSLNPLPPPTSTSTKSPNNVSTSKTLPIIDSKILPTGESRQPETYLTTRPASKTKDTRADFIFTSDITSATFECRYNEEGWSSCTSPYHLTGLEEGSHKFEVRARTNGGIDTTPIRYDWIVDLTPPLTFLLPSTSSHSREAHFIFGSEAEAHFECRLDQADWEECLSPLSYEELTAGEHTFWVRGIDQVENIEPLPLAHYWQIEIAPPLPPVVAFPTTSPYYTNQERLVFQGTTAPDTEVLVNGNREGVIQSDDWWTWESNIREGEQEFVFQARNDYQETSEPIHLQVIGDTFSPTAALKNIAEVYETKDFLITWEGIDNTASPLLFEVDYRVNEEAWQVWQGNTTETEHMFRNAPVHQVLSFRVRAQDQAGNTGEWSEIATTRFSPSQTEHLVISQLITHTTESSKAEFIELYNPTNRTVYLNGLSLEKKAADGLLWQTIISPVVWQEKVIPPHGYFLVTGKDYGYETISDLSLEEELAYDESGHLRILRSDGEEIDRIGYGSAYEPEGLAMTSPPNGMSLQRKAHYSSTALSLEAHPEEGNGYDSDFNFFDFIIQDVVRPRASQDQAGSISLNSDLIALWHFDECLNETVDSITNQWFTLPVQSIVGRYGCAFRQEWHQNQDILWYFDHPITAFEATLSFYVREPQFGSRSSIFFLDSTNHILLGAGAKQLGNHLFYKDNQIDLPNALTGDTAWHLITVVYSHNYVAWYQDSELQVKLNGDYSLDRSLFGIFIGQDNYPWEIDELAVWQRALSNQEIQMLRNEQLPPHLIRPTQPSAELQHFWNFDEGAPVARDSIGGRGIYYPQSTTGRSGQALATYWYYPQINTSITSITSKDISLSYWRKRSDAGNGGGAVGLSKSQSNVWFGSGGGYNQSYYFFNGGSDLLSAHLPDDGEWHHVALVYDSYDYELRYYIDGILYPPVSHIWPLLPYDGLFIKEDQYGFYLDDLKIWQGALTSEEVIREYQAP